MDINSKIVELCAERGWSLYELSQETGITQSTLGSIMKRGNPPKIETLQRICDAFGLSLSQFFAESDTDGALNDGEKTLLSVYRSLPAEKQRALIRLLK